MVSLTLIDNCWKNLRRLLKAILQHGFIDAQLFQVARLLRELNKAYIGFKPALKPSKPEDRPTAVATGNWGCGAFGGNTTLKFIIQWLAATYARRDLVYFTFHDKKLASDLTKVRNAFLKKPYTIKEVWKLLCRYNKSDRTQTLLDFMVA